MKHVFFNAFVRCVKTRNKEEYTLSANLYFKDTSVDSHNKKTRFDVVCNDLHEGELDLINQIDSFIFGHEYTKNVAMSSLVISNRPYRNTKVLSQVTTWNLITKHK